MKNPAARNEQLPDGWHQPQPEQLPDRTWYPAGLALGITLLAWGPASTLWISLVGAAVTVACMLGWIGEMRRGG